jgi:photosystem II stability/assembly factor-like uncharacterized protein
VCAVLLGCGPGNSDPQWEKAFDAEPVGWLLNVSGPSGDDLYAVGGTPDQGAIMHFDGEGWSPLDTGLDYPLLNWVHPFAEDDIVMVGNEGTVIRLDGQSWSKQPTPTDQDLWGVWGASPDDLWAVGGNGRQEGQATILRYDGSSWSEVQVPDLERANVFAFFKVWGTSADNLWIVGQRGAILHWDGNELVPQGSGTGKDMISLWGTGPDHVVAVGGRSNGIAAVWDGSSWTSQELVCDEQSGIPAPGINGVWMGDPDTAHLVGVEGVAVELDPNTFECSQQFLPTDKDLHAVFGDDEGRMTAVGGNLATASGPYQGVAFVRQRK